MFERMKESLAARLLDRSLQTRDCSSGVICSAAPIPNRASVDKTSQRGRWYWHESRQQISADSNAGSSACGRVWGRHPGLRTQPDWREALSHPALCGHAPCSDHRRCGFTGLATLRHLSQSQEEAHCKRGRLVRNLTCRIKCSPSPRSFPPSLCSKLRLGEAGEEEPYFAPVAGLLGQPMIILPIPDEDEYSVLLI